MEQTTLLPEAVAEARDSRPPEKQGGCSRASACSALRRPMTACEIEAVNCLQQVTYPPASWDKRFARSMSGMTTITDKEAPQVWRLLKRYRRQISSPHKANLLMMADELAAPDFRKQQAQQRDRERLAAAMQNEKLTDAGGRERPN